MGVPDIRCQRVDVFLWYVLIFFTLQIALNTFTAKVNRDQFKYLRFNLPASTLVDLKVTPLFCLK
jgi:hypothetical protein